MAQSSTVRQTAIQAVARHFSASLTRGKGSADAYLTIAGKRVALFVTALESPASRRAQVARPRLRFDRVALGLIARLRTALEGSVPDERTVIATITAPIRLPARTAAAMEEKLRRSMATRSAPARLTGTIHGNKVQLHLLKGGAARTTKLIGFVHNPDSDPTLLIEVARAVLARTDRSERAAGRRWLVVASQSAPVPLETCRQVCSQLGLRKLFEQILVVQGDGRIVKLAA